MEVRIAKRRGGKTAINKQRRNKKKKNKWNEER